MSSAAAGGGSRVLLATGGYDSTVRLWDASAGTCYKSFAHPDKQVNCLALSPDKGSVLAGGNPLLRLYDVNAKGGDALLAFEGHSSNVTACGMDRAARFFFSSGEDGSVRIWDPRVGAGAVRDYDVRVGVNALVLHPNQGELISGDHGGAIRLWDLTANKCSAELVPEGDTPVASLAIAVDASLLAAANFNGNCYFWAPGGGGSSGGGGGGGGSSSSSGGVGSSGGGESSGGSEPLVPLKKLRAHKSYITAARISPDGRYFATAASDRTLKLWNTHDFSLAATLAAHTRWVWDAAFSADSSYIVTASSDLTAQLWDIHEGTVMRNYTGHAKAVTAVALNDEST